MKKCGQIKEYFSAYIDNELDAEELKKFEEHTGSCRQCRKELDELVQVVEYMKNFPEEELPDNFRAELHEKLLSAQRQTEVFRKQPLLRNNYFKLFSSVAAVFLLLFLIRGIYSFNIFPYNQVSESAEKTDMMAEAPKVQMKAAAPDSGDSNANSGNTQKMQAFAAADSETQTGNNEESITIIVENPEAQVKNIETLAQNFGGFEQPGAADESGQTYAKAEDGSINLVFNMPNEELSTFIDALSKDYGKEMIRQDTAAANYGKTDTIIVNVLLKKK